MIALAGLALPAAADEAPGGGPLRVPQSVDEQLDSMRHHRNGDNPAPLWSWRDPKLDARIERAMARIGLSKAVKRKKLGAVLVILDGERQPRVGAVNPDLAIYAASLPKIAILVGAFDAIERGDLEFDEENRELLADMIRNSSNSAATEMIRRVGFEAIARTMLDPKHRLYDPQHNGGLWIGREYRKNGRRWQRDPINNLSHGATPMQVARFYYLLEQGDLVSPLQSQRMKKLLSGTALSHKFARRVLELHPRAILYRKSGSWRTFHSDGALVKTDGRAYIAAALSDDRNGSEWLSEIAGAFDDIVFGR